MKDIVIIGSDQLAKEVQRSLDRYKALTFISFKNYNQADLYFSQFEAEFIIADLYLNKNCVVDLFVKHKIHCPIILLSADGKKDDFIEGQSVRPYIYLIKPFHTLSLASACISLIDKFYQKTKSKDQFIIKSKGKFITINLNDVHFIASEGNNCIIHFNSNTHIIRYPLSTLLEDIKSPYMVRSHRKYIINLLKVDQFDVMKSIVLINEKKLSVGRLYKKVVKSKLKAQLI